MSTKDQVIRSAIAGLIALGAVAGGGQALAAAGDSEKCAGSELEGGSEGGVHSRLPAQHAQGQIENPP